MPSVGPQLPPHLAKRKRSIDDDKALNSPPHKVQAAELPQSLGPTLPPHNPDELEVDSDSDDSYGPSLGPSNPATKPSSHPAKRAIEQAPPPSKNPDELEVNDSSSNTTDSRTRSTTGVPLRAPLPSSKLHPRLLRL
jgi:hypothetical protein